MKENFWEIFLKIWVYLARLSSFWKFLKMLFQSLLEVDKKMGGKHPALTGWNVVKDLQFFLLCLVYLPGDCLSCKYQSTPNTYYFTVLCFLGLQSWLV